MSVPTSMDTMIDAMTTAIVFRMMIADDSEMPQSCWVSWMDSEWLQFLSVRMHDDVQLDVIGVWNNERQEH